MTIFINVMANGLTPNNVENVIVQYKYMCEISFSLFKNMATTILFPFNSYNFCFTCSV